MFDNSVLFPFYMTPFADYYPQTISKHNYKGSSTKYGSNRNEVAKRRAKNKNKKTHRK